MDLSFLYDWLWNTIPFITLASGKSGSAGSIERLEHSKTKNEIIMPATESEWQARCIELELALQKFRDQAHNIRKLLRDKVSKIYFFFDREWSKDLLW